MNATQIHLLANELFPIRKLRVGDDVTVRGYRIAKYSRNNYIIFRAGDSTPIRTGIKTAALAVTVAGTYIREGK